MKKRTKFLSLLLAAAMTAAIGLTGCSSQPAPSTSSSSKQTPASEPSASSETQTEPSDAKPDTSEAVTLTMYLIGDRPVDNDAVFAKINDRLKAEINTTVDVKFMGWGEYEQKYPLIFASGEDWDMIYTADWCFYNSQATKQGFWEITKDDLETYAPMSAKTMYPEAWEQAAISGKVYMLPMNYKELTSYVYIARGDLMKKYGITSVSTLDEVETYLDAIAKNEKQLIPLDVGSDFDKQFMFDRMWSQATAGRLDSIGAWQNLACVAIDDDTVAVEGIYAQPEFTGVVKRLKDWKDRGFWSKNAVVNTQNNKESFAAGKSALALMNVNNAKTEYSNITAANPEWDIQVFDAQGNAPSVINSYLANGMSIFSKSKHPESALMALDYLRNDEECNNLFCYGIEGKHWEAAGSNKLTSLPDSSNYPYDGNCNWGVRNDQYWRTIEGGIPNFDELNASWQANARSSRFQSFVFNDEAYKNEIAALTEIFNTDFKLLVLGFTDDPEADIAKLNEKVKSAGVDKIYAEISKQGKEFLQNH